MSVPVLGLLALICSVDPRSSLLALGAGQVDPERGNQGFDLGNERLVLRLDKLVELKVKVDPADASGKTYLIDPDENGAFLLWYETDANHSGQAFSYVVECAYPKGTALRFDATLSTGSVKDRKATWRGRHGLAASPSLLTPLKDPDQRRRVSACLLAHANTRRANQYISLRGGPLALRDGEEFTMSYPEGVFFGDLFTTPHDWERYSMSLNLPAGYKAATASWWPLNAALGRTLDLDTSGLTTYLGRCNGRASPPPGTPNWKRLGEPTATAPIHKKACAFGSFDPASSACSLEEPVYFPLFVYLPRLFNLEDGWEAWDGSDGPPGNAEKGMQVFAKGSPERMACTVPNPTQGPTRQAACVGPYDPLQKRTTTVCGWRSTPGWAPPSSPSGVVLLEGGEKMLVVLRATSDGEEASAGTIGTPFTAIIRFRTNQQGENPAGREPVVRTRRSDGTWNALGVTPDWDTKRARIWVPRAGVDAGFSWMQVYPVFLLPDDTTTAKRKSLALEIEGAGDGTGVKLDAVGFVPGLPSCCEADDPDKPRGCPDAGAVDPTPVVCPPKPGDLP